MTGIGLADYYASKEGAFQKMSAYSKLIFFVSFLFVTISAENYLFPGAVFVTVFIFGVGTGLPVRKMLMWAFFPAFFASLFAFSQLVAGFGFPIIFLVRAYVAAYLALFYTFTTPYFETFTIFSKVSPFLATVLFFTYRYFFLFLDIVKNKTTMVKVRGGSERRFVSAGKIVGFLVLEMIDRAERIYSALKIRGFRGRIFYSSKKKMGRSDLALLIFTLLFVITSKII